MSEALDALRVAVAYGLPGAEPGLPGTGETPVLTAEVISLAAQHRVQGLLWSAIRAGAIEGDEQQIEAARDGLSAALRTCLVSEETAVLSRTRSRRW